MVHELSLPLYIYLSIYICKAMTMDTLVEEGIDLVQQGKLIQQGAEAVSTLFPPSLLYVCIAFLDLESIYIYEFPMGQWQR